MKFAVGIFASLVAFLTTSSSVASTAPVANGQCPLLDGAYVSEDVLKGGSGSVLLFSQGYKDFMTPDCDAPITMTNTASVPAVHTTYIIPDGVFREQFSGHDEAWKYENGRLVRLDRDAKGVISKMIEIYLSEQNGKVMVTYVAYVVPTNPNLFTLFAVSGPNAK